MIFDKKIYFVFFGISILAGFAVSMRSGKIVDFFTATIIFSFLSFMFTCGYAIFILMYESCKKFLGLAENHES